MHGKDQDFGARQASADLAGGLGAVDDRHRVVQQHDVRLRLERLADGLFAITSLANDGPPGLRLQDAAEARTHHFMVVCDEDSGHRFFPRAYCRTSTPSRASVETRVRANGKCRYRGTGPPELTKNAKARPFSGPFSRQGVGGAATLQISTAPQGHTQGFSRPARPREPAYLASRSGS